MYSYSFTTEDIRRALKEVFNDDSSIIINRFSFIKSEKKETGAIENIYEITTKKGNKYRIVVKVDAPDCVSFRAKCKAIKAIRKIK